MKPDTAAHASPPVILIVDDHTENLHLLSQMLQRQGYRIRVANSGGRALAAVHANPPDLILLDIMMPDTDGYAVCEQLKRQPTTHDIPILFISALNDTVDKVKAFEVGGVDYITKPFQVQEVLARVETHLTLRRLRQELAQQVADLDAFAHTVAHDLKNPLNILTSYTSLLEAMGDAIEPGLLEEAIDAIARTSYRMADIINALLLLASVRQADDVPIAALDMAEIVANARERLAALLQTHQAQIAVPNTWPVALGYAPWVEEIWENLISNAIKYGRPGDEDGPFTIELGAQVVDATGETVQFWVQDHGPGIAPEDQAHLFTAFHRLPRKGGHGLGLSIVRRIVARLGGEVGVESAPGEGSRFTFTLTAG
jgi:two-component system, sensor histidine kinase and response regulator